MHQGLHSSLKDRIQLRKIELKSVKVAEQASRRHTLPSGRPVNVMLLISPILDVQIAPSNHDLRDGSGES